MFTHVCVLGGCSRQNFGPCDIPSFAPGNFMLSGKREFADTINVAKIGSNLNRLILK